MTSAANVRRWMVVKCLNCGHEWDEEDPESEVCACLDKTGKREVVIVAQGASNV